MEKEKGKKRKYKEKKTHTPKICIVHLNKKRFRKECIVYTIYACIKKLKNHKNWKLFFAMCF